MKLTDGQVVDFTKDGAVRNDERFALAKEYAVGTSAVIGTPHFTDVVVAAEPTQLFGDEDEVEHLSSVWATPAPIVQGETFGTTFPLQQPPLNPWHQPLNPLPLGPIGPLLVPQVPIPFQPSYPGPVLQGISLNPMHTVTEKVTQRLQALQSLNHKTDEVNTTIKTLEWVLETITQSHLFNNGNIVITSTNKTEAQR